MGFLSVPPNAAMITPFLQRRKQRLRKTKALAPGYTGRKEVVEPRVKGRQPDLGGRALSS